MKFVGVARDRKVFLIVSNSEVRELGVYDWGANPPTVEMRNLARRILIETTGDGVLATRLYMRFMYRTFAAMKLTDDWQMTDKQVADVVGQLKDDDRDIAMVRQMVGREMPRVQAAGPQFPGRSGFGGNDTAPDRRK